MTLCVPHKCHCGALVDAQGLHGFVCKKAPGRPTRHHALNDLSSRELSVLVYTTLDLQLQQLQPLDGCSSNPWMDSDPRPNPNPNRNPSPNPMLDLSLRRH